MAFMSVDAFDLEPCQVWHQETRRARKEHKCSACRGIIERGHRYVRHTTLFDGSWETVLRCLKCDAIYDALVELHSEDADFQVDIRLNCGHSFQDTFGCEPPEELQRIAFMTAEEAQQRLGGSNEP